MNRSNAFFHIALCACLLFPGTATAVDSEAEKVRHRISWKSMRDKGVVRQQFDFSCGAASIATLLTSHFLEPVDEMTVLKLLPTVSSPYSLADMSRALKALGYDSSAIRLSMTSLQQLSAPAILYMQPKRPKTTVGHFVVLKRVGKASITVADPSLGNRTYAVNDFLRQWIIPGDKLERPEGIALLVRKAAYANATNEPGHRENDFFRRGEARILLRGRACIAACSGGAPPRPKWRDE